jgi:hypothetical protein
VYQCPERYSGHDVEDHVQQECGKQARVEGPPRDGGRDESGGRDEAAETAAPAPRIRETVILAAMTLIRRGSW